MSGGSYDYAYFKVGGMAERLKESTVALRRVFAAHLKMVAEAMHDIEWVDSCDYSDGDELKAIKKCLGERAKTLELAELVKEAKTLVEKINEFTSQTEAEALKKKDEK